MKLPVEFEEKIRHCLEGEYEDFLASYDRPRRRGLRVNLSKISSEKFAKELAGTMQSVEPDRVLWTDNGFYVSPEIKAAQHPYYAAGLYYMQEPSAMYPAACLPVDAGDKLLDLCAAPGGKATELAVKLEQKEKACPGGSKGVLIANEIDSSRAKALLHNLELTGMRNYCVLNETPERLAKAFPEYFNKILVDAPCSGEGMFRKEEAALTLWSQERVEACAKTQKDILEQAYVMLKPGGQMVYSTCTFSPEEDEQQIDVFTEAHPDMIVLKQERLWPHKVEGEGHFLTLLIKRSSMAAEESPFQDKKTKRSGKNKRVVHPNKEQMALLQTFFRDMTETSDLRDISKEDVEIRQDRAYLPAADTERLNGLHVIRNGLWLGEWKKKRFEPSQPLALSLAAGSYTREIRFSAGGTEIEAYLRGESIRVPEEEKGLPVSDGWTLVCVEQWPVGWGKTVNGVLKNHYPAGWRK